jgi:hypothetical protein
VNLQRSMGTKVVISNISLNTQEFSSVVLCTGGITCSQRRLLIAVSCNFLHSRSISVGIKNAGVAASLTGCPVGIYWLSVIPVQFIVVFLFL